MRRSIVFLWLCSAAFAANLKLYLKDGEFQPAREYQVLQDRVRYYSTERSEWEELPLELVDLERTRKEAGAREEAIQKDMKAQAEEDAALKADRDEIARIPQEAGVYYIHGDKLETVKIAESKLVTDKKRAILKRLSPVPLVAGKSTVELDGETSAFKITGDRPQFYFRMSAPETLAFVKLGAKKGVRVVETVSTLEIAEQVTEDRKVIATFKKSVDDLLYRIWPEEPLEPGEYALIQFIEGKVNPQVWDFHVGK